MKEKSFNPKGGTINNIQRYGKVLHFTIDKSRHLLSGLGMTGSWILSDESLKEKHVHLEFKSDKNKFLSYVDPRRFGSLRFTDEAGKDLFLKKLGPDPLSDEFTLEYLTQTLKKYPNRMIKPFLLDQKFFPGIGNYLACEICALGGVRPGKRVKRITKREMVKIYQAFFKSLNGSIKAKGNTFWGGYRDSTGNKGNALENLVVFFQKQCGICQKTKVKKIILAGRGTYYCPKCQK
jgi:formamidopyrimidine-DNA glycosylase